MCVPESNGHVSNLAVYRNASLLAGQAKMKKEHPRRVSMEC